MRRNARQRFADLVEAARNSGDVAGSRREEHTAALEHRPPRTGALERRRRPRPARAIRTLASAVASRSGSRLKIADRADVAQRDVDDARLHRVADAGHDLPAAVRRRARASRSMPRPMPMSHARRSTIAHSASSSGRVASAQRMKPPRHGAASNGGCRVDDPAPVDGPREREARRRPTAARVSRRLLGIAARDLDVVDAMLAAGRGVRDRVARGVELMRAVLLRVGPLPAAREAA